MAGRVNTYAVRWPSPISFAEHLDSVEIWEDFRSKVVDQLVARHVGLLRPMDLEVRELYRLSRVWHGICNLELLYDRFYIRSTCFPADFFLAFL